VNPKALSLLLLPLGLVYERASRDTDDLDFNLDLIRLFSREAYFFAFYICLMTESASESTPVYFSLIFVNFYYSSLIFSLSCS